MAKVMKKISAILLTLALVVTMMPAMALSAYAEDGDAGSTNVFNVHINGVDTGKGVTREWLEENSQEAQIFPFPGGQGKKWAYIVAKGASFEAVLKETLGIDSYADLAGANIRWNNASGEEQGKFDLPVDMLAGAVTEFKLVDQDGNDVTGAFTADTITDVKAVALDGAADVVSVVSTSQKEFASYDEAKAALDAGTWAEGAGTSIIPYIGGNLTDESQNYLKKDGTIKMGVFNFVGKFAMSDQPVMNIKMAEAAPVDMTFDNPSAEAKALTLGYTFPAEIVETIAANAEWTSSDEAVAKAEGGKVIPVGTGTCTLTAKAAGGKDAIGTINVTVGDKAFDVSFNGIVVGSVDRKWLEENAMEAQIFPFPGGQGKKWAYIVAKGASFEAVLKETLGIESYADLAGANIRWNNASGEEQGKFDLPVDLLAGAVTEFKLVDQDGNDVTGAFTADTITDVKAVALDGAADVVPVVSTSQKEFKSYDEAKAALDAGTWAEGAGTSIIPYIGGNLTDESQNYLKKDGAVKMGVFNFLGKFAMSDQPVLNIKMTLPEAAMTFEAPDAAAQTAQIALPEKLAAAVNENAVWASDNESVAKVASGKVTPAAAGSCVVTATVGTTAVATFRVTVKEKAVTPVAPVVKAPAVPKKFKVKNVKKKSVKLTWKKVSGAKGYVIYRSTKKNKGFKKIATIKKASTVKYTNKKLKKGKTYYYKIRAYKKVNGKTVYSKYTSVKKVKIKK